MAIIKNPLTLVKSGSSGVNPMQVYIDNNGGNNIPSCNYLFFTFQGSSQALEQILSGVDTSRVTDFSYMFTDCSSLTNIPQINTSSGINFRCMFRNCRSLTTIPILNTSNGTDFSYMFESCHSLTTISALDLSNGTNFGHTFNTCPSLKTFLAYGMKVSFDISASTQFDREDLVTILNNLATVSSTQTLTMGSTNLAKLTADDIAIATNKGWTLA